MEFKSFVSFDAAVTWAAQTLSEYRVRESIFANTYLLVQLGVEYWEAMVKYNGATGKWDAQRPVEKSE
jgi:hypothetical protein